MAIQRKPFVRYSEGEENRPDIFTIRLGPDQRSWLEQAKIEIQQPKDSTAIKLLAEIGAAYVLHDTLGKALLRAVYRNLANNARMGIPMQKPISDTDVTLKKGVPATQMHVGPPPRGKGV